MKTLILYTTTYGLTETLASKLADQIEGDVDQVNLMRQMPDNLTEYHQLILGGSIYMGQIQKKMKQYCTDHEDELLKHPISLFLCSGIEEDFDENLKKAFSVNLLSHSKHSAYFGGVLDTSKMKFMHKMITKIIVKSNEKEGKPLPQPKEDVIKELATKINADLIQ